MLCVCLFFVSQKTILSFFYQVNIKGSEGVEPEVKKKNAPMAMKWLINIHEVRNHSGARHQSQKVVKTLFLISSRHSILHCSFLLCVLGPSLFISVDYIVFVSRYKCVDVCWRSVHSVGDLNRSLFSRHSLLPPLQGMHTSQKIAPAASFAHTYRCIQQPDCALEFMCTFVNHKPLLMPISTLVSKVLMHIFIHIHTACMLCYVYNR